MQHVTWLSIILLICGVIPRHAFVIGRPFSGRWKIHAIHGAGDPSTSGVPPTTIGQQTYSQYKSNAQMNQLNNLLSQPATSLSESQVKQLQALSKSDSYDATKFSPLHREFKREHNLVFAALGAYCSCSGRSGCEETTTSQEGAAGATAGATVGAIVPVTGATATAADADAGAVSSPLFYLDGKDGGSTSVLLSCGYPANALYTANMFPDTCAALRDTFPTLHVHAGPAHEVLRTPGLRQVPFVGYYLDGCGGSPWPVVSILEAIFAEERAAWLPDTLAIGECNDDMCITQWWGERGVG